MSEIYLFDARAQAISRLTKIKYDLSAADSAFGHSSCVYATGSFGRLESGPQSDLDLFIVIDTDKDDLTKPKLNSVDEIKLKHEIIRVAEANNLPKFDGGGKFLASHSIISFTKWLGSNEDDYRNTLTGRMLMLLESKPLIGEKIYYEAINNVIAEYFRDFPGHENNFMPAFLINDIIRMWRTFCVNYEFYRKDESRNKIKNLKLKFSRMLTCYSGVIYLLAVFARNSSVTPEDVSKMVVISPTERLQLLIDEGFGLKLLKEQLQSHVEGALNNYSHFLQLTHEPAKKSLAIYEKDEIKWRDLSYEFGGHLSDIIDILGRSSVAGAALRRLILI